MADRIFLGVDPGVESGALGAVLGDGSFLSVHDAPWLASGQGGRKEPDLGGIRKVIGDLSNENTDSLFNAFVELVRPFGPKLNALAVHSLAQSEMAWRALMLGFWPVERLEPKRWQKAVGYSASKGATPTERKHALLATARGMFPEAPLDLVKHDGRAAALLIAEAGRRITLAGAGSGSVPESGR